MSINRVPINGATSGEVYYQGKAQFCFYRKGSVASGLTDVAVYADNEYMGLMSPTEHFRLNRTVNTWKFKPVDTALVGEFVLADSAEEYSTSQVAGTVSVSSIPDLNLNYCLAGNAYTAGDGGTFTNPAVYLVNPIGNTKTMYVQNLGFETGQAVTNMIVDLFSYTGGSFTDAGGNSYSRPVNKFTKARDSGCKVSNTASGATGTNDDARLYVRGGSYIANIKMNFDVPIAVPPGNLISISATGTSIDYSFYSNFLML